MIPPRLETQIRENMEATRTQALLAQMFSGINQRTETAAREREDDKPVVLEAVYSYTMANPENRELQPLHLQTVAALIKAGYTF